MIALWCVVWCVTGHGGLLMSLKHKINQTLTGLQRQPPSQCMHSLVVVSSLLQRHILYKVMSFSLVPHLVGVQDSFFLKRKAGLGCTHDYH